MAPVNRKPGGWVVPGYRYLGPFNPLNNGTPINAADRAAQKHDYAYNDYINKGKNPYLYYNKADSDFLQDLESDRSFGGWIGKTVFGIKRAIAPSLSEPSNKKAKTDSRAEKRKLYFARSNKSAKKPNMGDAGTSDQQDNGGGNEPSAYAGGGSGGSGGGGGGNHGVGISTGGWSGGCYFSDHCVITTVTRQWYAPIYNDHMYKKIVDDVSGNLKKPWEGISTPWGYFNFNCYHSHFSPQDWQRLTNEYQKWRPKKMHVKIYNLQIKQIVTMGPDTLYNNDLTAGVHIFCDGSHQYPYAQHPWDEQTLPELPNTVYRLPQYAYFQQLADLGDADGSTVDNIEKLIRLAAPLYMLEHSSHEVLRTGEETSFSFEFDSGWITNDRAFCPPQADFNPLIPTRRYYPLWKNVDGTYKYMFTKYRPYTKPSNWMPGPYIAWKGNTASAAQPNAAKGPFTTVYTPPGTENQQTQTSEGEKIPSLSGVQQAGFDTAPVNCAMSSKDYPSLAFDASEHSQNDNLVSTRNVDIDMNRIGTGWIQRRNNDNNVNISQQELNYLFPNQTWNNTPITRDTPIWDKVPRADCETIKSSSDGTLPMHHPPGTIFVKVAKIPIPTSNNADAYLNIYVTGQVTCQIVWETVRYQTKNWRPEVRNTISNFENRDVHNFDANGVYRPTEVYGEGMPTKLGINRVN